MSAMPGRVVETRMGDRGEEEENEKEEGNVSSSVTQRKRGLVKFILNFD